MCHPVNVTQPAVCECSSAPGTEPCSGTQLLGTRLRRIGDQLEKSRENRDSASYKTALKNSESLIRGFYAVCTVIQITAMVMLIRKRYL